MQIRLITVLPAIVCGGLLIPSPATAQSATRTTEAGVYQASQATRGEQTFASICTGCHTVATHSGPAFMKNWTGYTLWDLLGYISNTMPKSDPGSLSATEYADLVAYILRLNGMPAGDTALPVDSVTLKAIRIDTTTLPIPVSALPRGRAAITRIDERTGTRMEPAMADDVESVRARP